MRRTLYRLVAWMPLLILWDWDHVMAHEAKDFDDTVLYKIHFAVPGLIEKEAVANQLRTFYTHDQEKYECLIPALKAFKEEEKSNQPEMSPITLLQPIFSAPTCSYRIEAYWSYEICHGQHVRQYHEEREGKHVKFQEYYLGKWTEDKTELLIKAWEEERKTNTKPKYKTLKIDNVKYPYFEMELTDGTMCDIIDAPRTTLVRYVCYPHGKDDIYSFKETSSCNYEAIILTSALCVIPGFHAEETEEIPLKCFNSDTEPTKPLSLLRQELRELQEIENDLLGAKKALNMWPKTNDEMLSFKYNSDMDNLLLELIESGHIDISGEYKKLFLSKNAVGTTPAPLTDLTPIKDFISGKNCLTGGTGWWKYEFCYGRHVRQFHKDKNGESELFLGFFSEATHRQWINLNPDKGAHRDGTPSYIWHHYDKGTHCDRTGLPREVDVKLTCTPVTTSGTAVSMYLVEPKTCQYILGVESSIICDLMQFADEYGLVKAENLQKIINADKSTERSTESEEEIRS